MSKIVREIELTEREELAILGKALSSPIRLEMLSLLGTKKLTIAEIGREMNIPASSAAMHVKALSDAQLIRLEKQPGTRGEAKLCSRKIDKVDIFLSSATSSVRDTVSVEMPIGAYTECQIEPTCGLSTREHCVGMEDAPECFYDPERLDAQILWTSGGYVEYIFPNKVYSRAASKRRIYSLSLAAEICSEASGYREDWKSDITLWVNGRDCGTWTSPGDFGLRRGRLNPDSWGNGKTQYGLLTTWTVRMDGTYLGSEKISDTRIDDLNILADKGIRIRIGVKEDAVNSGGFNLFGRGFGDYPQDIVLTMIVDADEKSSEIEGQADEEAGGKTGKEG